MKVVYVHRWLTMKTISTMLIGYASLFFVVGLGFAETGISSHVEQIYPMRQDSLKVSSLNDVPMHAPVPSLTAGAVDGNTQPPVLNPMLEPAGVRSDDPSGRRDPLAPVRQQLPAGRV